MIGALELTQINSELALRDSQVEVMSAFGDILTSATVLFQKPITVTHTTFLQMCSSWFTVL